MAFKSTYELIHGAAKITLTGELDANAAPTFRADIEHAVADKARNVALLLKDLKYLGSAGLRALVFAKQKLGPQVTIFMIGGQETVRETINMTGFQNNFTMLAEYDAAQIEK